MKKVIVGALLCVIALIGSEAQSADYIRYSDIRSIPLAVDSESTSASVASGVIGIGPVYGYSYMYARLLFGEQVDSSAGSGDDDSGVFILRTVLPSGKVTDSWTLNVDPSGFPDSLIVELPGGGVAGGTADSVLRPEMLELFWSYYDTVEKDTCTDTTAKYHYPLGYEVHLRK